MFWFHLLMNGMDKMIHVMTLKEILSVFLMCVDIIFILLQNFITKFPFMEFKCRRRYFNYISRTVFFYFTFCYIPSTLLILFQPSHFRMYQGHSSGWTLWFHHWQLIQWIILWHLYVTWLWRYVWVHSNHVMMKSLQL